MDKEDITLSYPENELFNNCVTYFEAGPVAKVWIYL